MSPTSLPVYLDHNATTPVAPEVVEAMLPFLREQYGNPSSAHVLGAAAAEAVDKARGQVAALLGCAPDEVVFTSCATESDNLAIKGVALANRRKGRHLVTTAVEHPAVRESCRFLQRELDFAVTVVPVERDGRVTPEALERALRPDTVLVSIIHAQNETGVLQPLRELSRLTRARGIPLHVDAAQSVGKIPVRVEELGCDLLTLAGHKMYGPKGVGALYVRRGLLLQPQLHGAPYEGGRRAGTLNVPYIVGLGVACEMASYAQATGEPERLRTLRDRLHRALAAQLDARLNGHPTERLPNTVNVCIPGVEGNALLARVPEVAASTGSACHAGVNQPSEILTAMGVEPALAVGALRLSLGRSTTAEDIDFAVERLVAAVRR